MIKLKILSYNENFIKKFEREKKRIIKIVKACEIKHIGSTAIPGLGGKGIIDMMIGIKDWKESANIIKGLRKLSFNHVHPKEKGRIFLSKNTSLSLNNIHIHIVKTESKAYKELIFFRDYLRKSKKEVENYNNLKIKWLKELGMDREKYRKLKSKYISQMIKNKGA